MTNRNRIIKASDFSRHGYCARAWWLESVQGETPANQDDLRRGAAAHAQHGRKVWGAGVARAAAAGLLILGLMALAAAIFLQ